MKYFLGNYFYETKKFDINETMVFEKFGKIKASAIKRLSKNHYRVYMITNFSACCLNFTTFKESINWLKKQYKLENPSRLG